MASDFARGWLALTFVFSASPAISAMRTEVIQRAHHITQARNGPWPVWGPLLPYIFVGDAIFADADLWDILNETVEGWGTSRRNLFGGDSINEGKTRLECDWGARGLVLGFDLDAVEETISASLPKIEGSRIYILSGEFVVGSQRVYQKASQPLRWYMMRRLAASLFWDSCVQPVDLLMAYGSEECSHINCSNFQIWSGYCDMLSLVKSLAQDRTPCRAHWKYIGGFWDQERWKR